MFKRQIAFILILTLVTSSFSRFFIYAGFELNRDYISSTLCENIDMPELHCNGQCYLAKKIQQAQEKEKNNTQDQKKGNYQEAFITQKVVLITPFTYVETFTATEMPFDLPVQPATIFHPPKINSSILIG
ncbi:hypothetical protein [Albibacterium bauzanense]|uniref:Uncharacterized protein n=1 Tax=Albibacterium bauzanense TaxID=653929 RepID=A0A4R1M276_9SPHI|nr:hypothetical protein [Albibacterium bauzanense]TCK85487.1 hypothetical protein C8N28_0795 [Albibacterium bauzanense]